MAPEGVDPEIWQRNLEDSYRVVRDSIAFQDLLHYIDDLRESSLEEAVDSKDVNYSYGLLQNAQACKTIKSYIERMTS